jgi:hypothetical protein
MKPELSKESKRQQRQLDTSARRGSSLEEKIYVIRVVHAVENMFIAFLPHIPPAVKEDTCRLPIVSDTCICDVLLKPFNRLWARQTRDCIPCKLNHNQIKDVVDELMFCILRL